MNRAPLLLLAAAALLLALPATASADDATLSATLNTWSQTIGADAHSVALAAQNAHPRRMIYSARRFRRDALLARAAITLETPSTTNGQQARQLALSAFANYAIAGRKWVLSGRARLAHYRALSIAYANAGARYARIGDTQLVAAGKLLP